VQKRIIGYHLDEEQHWVAELECGHHQHVRHQPPWTNREWVTAPEGRASRIGTTLDCKKCDERLPPDPLPTRRGA
jgi:hypothetical protein